MDVALVVDFRDGQYSAQTQTSVRKPELPGSGVLVLDGLKRGRAKIKSGPKSRLGCKQCKRRRIKCDESQPVCMRCRTKGLDCDFVLGSWGSRSSRSAWTFSPLAPDHRILVEPRVNTVTFEDQLHWDSFHMFVSTIFQTGTLPLNDLSAITPQIAQSNVAVREISCAVGAAGRLTLGRASEATRCNDASLLYQTRGLQALRAAINDGNPDLTLTLASVLLVTLAMLYGDVETATMHFEYGHDIVRNHFDRRCKDSGVGISRLSLTPLESATYDMFHRLATYPWPLKLGLAGPRQLHVRRSACNDMHRYELPDLPTWFKDLHDALVWWDATQHDLLFHRSGASMEDAINALHRWHESFAPLLQSTRRRIDIEPETHISALVLESLYVEDLTRLHQHVGPAQDILPDVEKMYLGIVQTIEKFYKQLLNNDVWLGNPVIRPLVFILSRSHNPNIKGVIRDILASKTNRSYGIAKLLDIVSCENSPQPIEGLENLERSFGWDLLSCGCNAGVSSHDWRL